MTRLSIGMLTLLSASLASGCAQLHQVQLGDIYADEGTLVPFDLKVSETGINIQEGTRAVRALGRNSGAGKSIGRAGEIIGLFQYGPRTGNLVFSEDYADSLAEKVRAECPSGKLTGLVSIRETRKYPVISGEIVRITGYCIMPRKGGA